jgi:hypothetical membrane protein
MGYESSERVAAAEGGRRFARSRFVATAGVLLFVAGLVLFLGITTAEALYPDGYSTGDNTISDLGATEPPNSVVQQPSAIIFDATMIVAGALGIVAAFCLLRGFRRVAVAVLTALTGLGILGVGAFPADTGNVHAVFAYLAFIGGGLAAIVSVTVQSPPFSVLSAILGVVSLVSLVLYMILGDSGGTAGLGVGGVERWVAYPILAWTLAFGGYLMGRAR